MEYKILSINLLDIHLIVYHRMAKGKQPTYKRSVLLPDLH